MCGFSFQQFKKNVENQSGEITAKPKFCSKILQVVDHRNKLRFQRSVINRDRGDVKGLHVAQKKLQSSNFYASEAYLIAMIL